MTIKGKRAGALRKMERGEAESYRMGGVQDTKFPIREVHSVLKEANADIADFDEFFGRALGRFRMFQKSVAPTVAQERDLVGEAMGCIEQARMRLDALPPYATALMDETCMERHGEPFFAPAQRLDAALDEVWRLLVVTRRKLEPQKTAGRKSEHLRDELLCDVAHWLQERNVPKEAAAAIAARVLLACKIKTPNDPRKARELVRKREAPRNSR